jgi:cytochrome c biogenesis factor
LVSLFALLVEVASGVLAWWQWKKSGREWVTHAAGPLYRERFMAIGGLVLSAGFATVVIAQSIPALVLGACE